MLSVEQLIGDLLLRHNCVVVPSFGGFVAKKTSATIDYKNGVIMPPKKSVLFNRQLINNDGLLVAEYATAYKSSYSEAESIVSAVVSEWNQKLRNGERITLDKVGYLFFDQEKNLCFEQDRFFNLLLESYGLGKVHFVSEEDIEVAKYVKAVQEQKVQEEEEKVNDTFQLVALPFEMEGPKEEMPTIIEHPNSKGFSKLWRYVAAAVIAPIGFYSFWIPMNSNVLESGVLSFKDFDLSYKATEGTYSPLLTEIQELKIPAKKTLDKTVEGLPNDVYVYSYPFDEDTYISVKVQNGEETTYVIEEEAQPVSKPIVEEVKAVPTPIKKVEVVKAKPVAKVETAKLNFVVGAFSTKENAQVLIDKMNQKGFNAFVLPETGGVFRVSAGKANTEAEIRNISAKAKANGFDGWILR